MSINEEQIRKLIKNYEVYKRECMEACTDIGSAKAGLYHLVLHDLNELLPRETLEDVAGDDLAPYLGTWVEYEGRKALVVNFAPDGVRGVIPKTGEVAWFRASDVFPLSIPRAWDEDGDLAY